MLLLWKGWIKVILFVGDKPSPKMKPGANPFKGAACESRLKAWISQLTTTYKMYNSDSFVDISSVTMAHLLHNYKIVALGNNASKRLAKYNIPHFKLPHPSGRNRQINDKSYIEAKLTECKKYISDFSKV